MNIHDLIDLAKKGQLTLQIHDLGRRTRLRYIWDKNKDHITGTVQIPYTLHSYHARTELQPEGQSWKINKKDYKLLNDILNEKGDNF